MNTTRHILIVLALTLAALLVPLSAPVAQAAPPEVTASENPVVIDIATKEITLTWSLAPFPPGLAALTVTESGTPTPVLSQTVSQPPGTGTVPLKVTVGKTYTAQLKDAFGQPLGKPLTITTKKAEIAAPGPGCKLDCITGIHADEVYPNSAHFTISTNTPAFIQIALYPMKKNESGVYEVSGPAAAATATLGLTQNWTPTLNGLTPNTRYHVEIRAKDGWGNEQVNTGIINTPSA